MAETALLISEPSFIGLDASRQPNDLPPGYVSRADNVIRDGDDFVSRPGLVGQLLTPHGAPVYVLGAFRNPEGTTALLYTTGGKLYKLTKGASAATEILNGTGGSLSLVSSSAFGTRLGKYFYIVDGAGPLIRTDLTSGVAVTGLSAPTGLTAAALTSTPIAALTSGAWSSDGIANPSTNLITNLDLTGAGWTRSAGASNSTKNAAYVWIDQAGDTVTSGAIVTPAFTVDTSRYANFFNLAFTLTSGNNNDQANGPDITVYAWSTTTATGLLGQITQTLSDQTYNLGGGRSMDFSFPFDFTGLAAQVRSVTVEFRMPDDHHFYGCAVGNPRLTTLGMSFAPLSVAADGSVTLTPGSFPLVAGVLECAGSAVVLDFGSNQNWGAYSEVFVRMLFDGAIQSSLKLALTFRASGSSTTYTSNTLTMTGEGGGVDITTVPASVRSAFRYLGVKFLGNPQVINSPTAPFLTIQALISAGNLSIGYADYSVTYTEVNGNGDAALVNVIESNPAKTSPALTPTVSQAEGRYTLPTSATNAAATHLAVYRYGGVFSDVPIVGRLLAVVPRGSDVAYGADPQNPYYSWNRTTGVFIDNTPDSWILQPGVFPVAGTPLVLGRDSPPVGAQAICAYHSHLMLAKGSDLYISWLVTGTTPDALYFTAAQITNDPNGVIKGATIPVGGSFDNDPVAALVPTNVNVVLEKQTGKSVLVGSDGLSFTVQDYLKGTGVGCVAPRTAVLFFNEECALGSAGPYLFDLARVEDEWARPVEKLLRPKGWDGAAVISASALALCASVVHDKRLLLFAPVAGGSVNSVAYVFDARYRCWTRWLNMPITSGVSLTSGTDSDDVFLGGLDGQVYGLGGALDKALPGSAGVFPAVNVVSRGFHAQGGDGWLRQQIANKAFCRLTAPAGTQITLTTTGDDPAQANVQTQTLSGRVRERITVPSGVRGDWVTLGVGVASATGQIRLTGYAVQIAQGTLL